MEDREWWLRDKLTVRDADLDNASGDSDVERLIDIAPNVTVVVFDLTAE